MATIGQQLLAPESGWRRYDDNSSPIIVVGTQWDYIKSNAWGLPSYHGTITALRDIANDGSNYITFKFKGTKLRLISYGNVDHSNKIEVVVDGNSDYYSGYYVLTLQLLVYEKTGLSNDVHTVVIKSISSGRFALDAIDVDFTGKLIHIKEKFDLKDMEIGDVISCEYTATANSIGAFANIGNAQKDLIPVASSSTPNGSFYFKHTGFDHLGRKKLVADRNIQHSISWDKINEIGAVGGVFSKYDISLPLSSAYLMNEGSGTILNDIGRKYNGTITGATWIDTPYGKGLSFDGVDDKVQFSNIIVPNGNKSIRFKIKADANPNIGVILSNLTATNFSGEQIFISNSTLNLGISLYNPNGTIVNVSSFFTVKDGNWHDILITFDRRITDTMVSIYVDDLTIPKNAQLLPFLLNSSSINHVIGSSPNSISYFKGHLSQLEIYSDVIDPTSTLKTDKINFVTRLLSGGVSATDKDNEWDKSIAESTLNGTIIAGDNSEWNWSSIASWTSATHTTSTNRVIRGNTAVGTWNGLASGTANTTTGFRPMLLVEVLNQAPVVELIVPQSVTNSVLHLSGRIYDKEENKFSYRVLLNTELILERSNLTQEDLIDLSLNLIPGNNTILVYVEDEIDTSDSINYVVNFINSSPTINAIGISNTTPWIQDNPITLSFILTDSNEDNVMYEVYVNNVQKSSSALTSPPLSAIISISPTSLAIGDNDLKLIAYDKHNSSSEFYYTLIKEDESTFSFKRRFNFPEHEYVGNLEFDITKGVTGNGEIILKIPTDGKGSLSHIVIDNDLEETSTSDIILNMEDKGILGEGKIYSCKIDMSKYKRINGFK